EGPRPAEKAGGAASGGGRAELHESYNLGVLVRAPELLFRIDRAFGELKMDRIGPEDFSGAGPSALIDLIRQSLLEDDPEQFLAERTEESLGETMAGARESFMKYHGGDAPTFEEALEAALRLRQRTLERQLADLRFYLMDVEQNPPEAAEMHDVHEARNHSLERINRISDSLRGIERALSDGVRSGTAPAAPPRPPGGEGS
ncbi:MAG: hypothetical protein WBM17_06045, partial [Anaerolineales bacterium]